MYTHTTVYIYVFYVCVYTNIYIYMYSCNAGDTGHMGSVPGSERSPDEGRWQPTHPSILAWKVPWTEESGGLYSPCGCKESVTTEWLSTSTKHRHTHTQTHTHPTRVHTHKHTCTHTRVCTQHTCTHAHTHATQHVCAHNTCMHTHAHTHAHTDTRTRTHTVAKTHWLPV